MDVARSKREVAQTTVYRFATNNERQGKGTNSQRLRVCRRATQSAQVVMESDTLQAQALTKVFRAASCATAKAGRSHSSMMGVGPA
jgi:hypothetical protein